MNALEKYKRLSSLRDDLNNKRSFLTVQIEQSLKKLNEVSEEGLLLESSLQALKDVKPILSAHSIEQCEKLANAALSSIFGTTATLEYVAEEGRFVINEGEFDTDLKEGNGGGYLAVISLVFNLFLLMKMKRRKFLCFDEHFTQISKEYFPRFFEFISQLSKDLGVDILLVTHDERIDEDMVDRIYVMDEGKAVRQK